MHIERLGLDKKFSREFERKVRGNWEFTLTKLQNSLENFGERWHESRRKVAGNSEKGGTLLRAMYNHHNFHKYVNVLTEKWWFYGSSMVVLW